MEINSNKKIIINKILLIVICIVLSIAFSFGLKTYIDYQGIRIDEEGPFGALDDLPCDAGTYKTRDETGTKKVCQTCPPGNYCKRGSLSPTPCPFGTTSNRGAKSEAECYKTFCEIKSITSVNGKKKSIGDVIEIIVELNGNFCSNYKLSVSNENGSITENGKDGNTYKYKVVSSNSCKKENITAILTNNNDSNDIDTASTSVEILPKWSLKKGETWPVSQYENMAHSALGADMAGVNDYITSIEECSKDSRGCYTEWYYRSCNNYTPPSDNTEHKACYKTSNGEYKWDIKKDGYTKVNGITKEADCNKPDIVDVSICEEKEIVPKEETKNVTCDGNINFEDDVTKSCSFETAENDFYKIICNEKLGVKLNPNTKGSIRLGLGFSYHVSINTIRTCNGEFDAIKFKEAYNNVKKNIENAASDAFKRTNENKLKDLKEILDNYNKWESKYNLDGITAKLKDEQTTNNINFIEKDNDINRGTKTKKSDNNLGISGLTNPIDFTYTEEFIKTLTLPIAYYNTNKIVYNKCDGCVKLSNQYYISDDRKYIDTDYRYTINVVGLGYNKSWNVKTNDCSLKVVEDPIIYRPVEVSDPFLESADSNRQTGRNWKNGLFDFTNIIKEDIWTKDSLYVFNITNQNVKSIRKNNSELGANAYLGTDCKLITSSNRYYCEFLRNDMYFHYHYIHTDNVR